MRGGSMYGGKFVLNHVPGHSANLSELEPVKVQLVESQKQ